MSGSAPSAEPAALRSLLEPRSIAVVGASARPGSFGARMASEVLRSPAAPQVHLVNPGYDSIAGRPCVPSLADVEGAVDLVLLGVGDASLEAQLTLAASRGDRAAVIFGNAYEPPAADVDPLRSRLASIAMAAGMQLCGGGCMGFINVHNGIRAIGYVEPDPVPAGPIALVTHSGSVFSAMLRARRGFGFTIAVSSGQELVTSTTAYLDYALDLPETRVVTLVVETIRDAGAMRAALARAADLDVPVIVLPVGTSEAGRTMVAAHSGAIAGGRAAWEALADTYGLHLVSDLAELTDTVELFAAGRRARSVGSSLGDPVGGPVGGSTGDSPCGIAAVLDSGAERALVVDVAADVGVEFAELAASTTAALADRLDPGLVATNPLDVWGTGADTAGLFGDMLVTVASDPAVRLVALAVDLVEELDGDESYPLAVRRAAVATEAPVVVLSHLTAALDRPAAAALRADGIPVLEGTRTGLLAIRHLLAQADRLPLSEPVTVDPERRGRWRDRLATGSLTSVEGFALLADYGIHTAGVAAAINEDEACNAAASIGYPVVLKTDEGTAHKTDVGGVVVGIGDEAGLVTAYRDLAARLGPRVVVCEQVAPGTEVLLGAVRDPILGPLIVVGAGGVLVELLRDRAAALPPVDAAHASRLVGRTAVEGLLTRPRHGAPADLDAVTAAVVGLSGVVAELGDLLDAIEINPLVCSSTGAVAVDVMVELAGQKMT